MIRLPEAGLWRCKRTIKRDDKEIIFFNNGLYKGEWSAETNPDDIKMIADNFQQEMPLYEFFAHFEPVFTNVWDNNKLEVEYINYIKKCMEFAEPFLT